MATNQTNKKLSPPSPTFYLTVGQSISCMLVKKTVLFVGTTCGSISLFSIQDCRKIANIKAFDKGGLLWLDLICTSDINIKTGGENNDKSTKLKKDISTIYQSSNLLLICQGRFDGVKLFVPGDADWTLWHEIASFCIPHSGFCGGFVNYSSSDLIIVAASEQSKIMIVKLVETFIRPIVSLNRDKSGTIMCVREWDKGKILAGYENSEIVLWDWSNDSIVTVVSIVDKVGTLMSIDWDKEKNLGVFVGAEDKVLVLNEKLEIVKERAVTNKGLGSVKLRPDGKIVVCGGWDGRLRIFSWLKPENLKPLAVLKFHVDSVESVVFSQEAIEDGRLDGKNLIFAGGKDGKVSIWNIY